MSYDQSIVPPRILPPCRLQTSGPAYRLLPVLSKWSASGILLFLVSLAAAFLPIAQNSLYAQDNVTFHWPLTAPDRVKAASNEAWTGFGTGTSVEKAIFDNNYGVMTGGWNSPVFDPAAFYEYLIAPKEGNSLEIYRVEVDISLGYGEMNTVVKYSIDRFRSQGTGIGQPVFFYTTHPQTLALPASITVSYPDTLSIRIYGWGAADRLVEFNNRNVEVEGVVRQAQQFSRVDFAPSRNEIFPENQDEMLAPLADASFTTPGTYNWTCPVGVTCIQVECWGGGGKGGAIVSNTGGGGGGGGGAYSRSVLTVVPNNTYVITVGTGSANTSPGGLSTFSYLSTTYVSAAGGNSVADNTTTGAAGGSAASGIGEIKYSGGNGANGVNPAGPTGGGGSSAGTASNGANATSYLGATAPAGGGNGGDGQEIGANGYGDPGFPPGGAGGGALRISLGSDPGGNGANGQVFITWTGLTITNTPVVSSPICEGATSVSGTSTEANGTVIDVLVNGISAGTTTVNANAWTKTGITPLIGGQVVTATAKATDKCQSAPSTGVTVTLTNTITLTSGNNIQTVCINTAISSITYTSTGATGAVFSGLPAGVSGNYSGGNITISGTPTASGTFNYIVTLTGGCGVVTASGTITVTPNNTITLTSGNNIQTICINTAISSITYTSTGATGASFSGLPAGVSGNYTGGNIVISGTPTISGTFNYTVTLTGGCGVVTATGTITVTPNNTITLTSGNNIQTVCINSAISSITYTSTGATGASFSGLPAGVSGNYTGGNITISGTPTVSGTFNYTVTLTGGCGNTSATGTINVNQKSSNPTSATASPATICNGGSSTLTLNGGGGGANESIKWYTGSCGGTLVGTGNNLAVSPSSTTIYHGRYEDGPPCNYNSSCASVTVVVNPLPSASLSASPASICLNESSTLTATNSGGTVERVFSGASGNINVSIPESRVTWAGSNILLSGSGSSTLQMTDIISVTINITHSDNDQLDIFLVDPSGTRAMLVSSDNGGTGNGYTNAILKTNVTPNINTLEGVNTVISGTYGTEGAINTVAPLNGGNGGNYGTAAVPQTALLGAQIDGNWSIRVFDDNNLGNLGTLVNWSLSITRPLGVYTCVFNGPGVIGPVTYSGTYNTTATCTVTPPAVGPNNYTVTTTDAMGCSIISTAVTVTVNPLPTPTISANYCLIPGFIRLTAHPDPPGYSYLWNTGATTQYIDVDVAGVYSVVVTNNATTCFASAFLSPATELVTDGSFTNFVPSPTSFFTEYTQNQAYYTGVPTSGLWPEGYYAVNTSAWSNYPNPPDGYHSLFHGQDHTNNIPGPRNFMMINGSTSMIGDPPHQRVIWQQTVPVIPNTDYYFSAWGMNLHPSFPAVLRFEVNGVQVGTIADLDLAPKPTTEAEVNLLNWIRFYSNPFWNSGSATTAVIRIINLNMVAGGNDFGLDDISFGTLAAPPFDFTPEANGGDPVCVGGTMTLSANVTGGIGPFSYFWSGPDGWTSTDPNPSRSPVTPAMAGTYTVDIADLGTSCPGFSDSFVVTIFTPPTCTISGAGLVCPSSTGNVYTAGPDMASYEWSITGNGTIQGATNGQSVTVTAGNNCNSPFTLSLTITSTEGCPSICSQVVQAQDITSPVFTMCPGNQSVIVNNGNVYTHSGTLWDATATDNCTLTSLSAMLSGATISGPHLSLNGVTFNQGTTTVTWTATDACGNTTQCSFNVLVEGTADIAVLKTGPATIIAGQDITFTITVTNNGPATAPLVTLTDALPPQIIAPATYTLNAVPMGNWPGTVNFNNMPVGPSGVHTITITGQVACDAVDFSNTATVEVSLPFSDPDLSNNTSVITVQVIDPLDVTGFVTGSSCPDDGEIDITVTGGTAPYTFSWTGPDSFISSDEDLAGLASGTYTVTVTDANGCTITDSWTVVSEDTEPPAFTPPLPPAFCVEYIITAMWDGQPEPLADITPDRPDWYILDDTETSLDLVNITDNCCAAGDYTISWIITFNDIPPHPPVSGTGQPSDYGEITLWGTTDYTVVVHQITYVVTDCNGIVSDPVTIDITINPRPNVIKEY